MHLHYLQHVAFEGLGYIADWAESHGHTTSCSALYADEPLPDPSTFDALVIMGGPMGVHDTTVYRWMTPEKKFIEAALKQTKKVLGICLGAQLIADTLGAKVYPNPEKEIGWYPVARASAAEHTSWAQVIPPHFQAFHWHGDTFDLPAGALHFAQNKVCHHQAFFYPPGVIGLQFHLEATKPSIAQLIQHCGHELVPAPNIQTAAEIESQADLIASSNQLMGSILDYFMKLS